MIRPRTPDRSSRSGGARGRATRLADLRRELFRQFFLPTAEEIRDRSTLARLDLPLELLLPPAADATAERLARDRFEVERMETANHQQRQLRCLVLEMLDYMARELTGPGDEAVLERWRAAADAYRRVLELPVMATPRARRLLRVLIDAPWPAVEQQAAEIERRWRPRPAAGAPAGTPSLIDSPSGEPYPPTSQGDNRWPTLNI